MNAVVDQTITRTTLPAIGSPLPGGVFAGISLHEDHAVALILLPEDGGERKHAAALDWAKGLEAELPTRHDMLVLYRNREALAIEEDWYWTGETHAGNAAYAWGQGFGYGNQYDGRKDDSLRCRAVRRVPI